MSRYAKISISVAVAVASLLAFSQTEVGKIMLDTPIGGVIQVLLATTCLVVFAIGLVSALGFSIEGNTKQVKDPVSVYRYESGVTIVQISSDVAVVFKKNPNTGLFEYTGQHRLEEDEIIVTPNVIS